MKILRFCNRINGVISCYLEFLIKVVYFLDIFMEFDNIFFKWDNEVKGEVKYVRVLYNFCV